MTTPTPTTWQVTGVSPATELDVNANPVKGYNVNFTLSSGPAASVFIRGDTFDPNVARQAIAGLAAQLDATVALTGTVGQ